MFPILNIIHIIIHIPLLIIYLSRGICVIILLNITVYELDNQSDHAPLVINLNIEREAELIIASEKSYTPRKI